MENKKLINEIIKINNLMGFNNNDHLTPDKLIISEVVTLFKTLLQDSPQAFKVFDDAMSAIKKTGRKITEDDIDDLVDIGLSKSLSKAERSELKSALKTHISTLNKESDFLTYLSNVPTPKTILNNLKNLTIADSDEFLKTALKRVVNRSKNLNTEFQTFILSIPNHLNDIRINGWMINSVEDYESYLRSYIRNQLSGIEEPSRTLMIDNAMSMIKSNDQYIAAIKKLDGSGNISTTVTNYSPQSNINLSDILTPKPQSTTVIGRKRTSPVLDSKGNPTIIEETLPPEIVTKYENIKIKSADGDGLTGAEQTFIDTVDGWKEFKNTIDDVNTANDGIGSVITPPIDISSIAKDMFDANNVLKGDWEDIFFGNFINKKFAWCQGELREYIVNFIRSNFIRTTEQFKLDIENTLTRIQAITDEIGVKTDADSIIRGDKLVTVKKALEELDVLSRRLKNSMLGAQKPTEMFESIWNETKVSIRKSLEEANMPYSRQEEILARIKGSGDDLTSIENWIKKTKGDFDVSEWQKLKNTRIDILDAWKQIPDGTKLLRKVFTKISIVIRNVTKLYLRNVINYMVIGVGTLKKNFLRIAFKDGMISRSGVCKNYVYLNNRWAKLLHAYLVVQLWVRVMTPVFNLFGNWIGTGVEALLQGAQGLYDPKMPKFDIYDTKDGVSSEEQFVIDFMNIFNPYIYDKYGKLPPKLNMPKINPLLNPIPGTMDWEFLNTIGFEPAPAPKFTYEAIGIMFAAWRNQGRVDDKKEDIVKIAEEEIAKLEENRTPEQIAKTQEFFNKAYRAIGESKDWYGLNESESETLKKHMYPETDLIDSEIWVCGDIPTKTDRNIYTCSGNRKWRMVFYEDGRVSLPDGDSNVNYKDKRYGKCYYVSNKAEENNPKPNSGTSDKNGNFENLKPIKGLIKDLI